VKQFEKWMVGHLVSIPYGETIQDAAAASGGSSSSSSSSLRGNSDSPRSVDGLSPRSSPPQVPARSRPLYVARKSDSSVFIDEHHFPGHFSAHSSGGDSSSSSSSSSSSRTHHGEGGGVVVTSSAGSVHGRSVTVFQCSHTSVFVVAPVAFLRVVGCSNCTVFVSVARFNVTIENCEFCDVTVSGGARGLE
jgi:hypothetical protein